ncbi:MAG: protein-disulfide reductase DsbD [Alphaproteobacteria bacterium]|nr:protein-disulfide reductase DsbD [Alphaproteobacteria bacterium]
MRNACLRILFGFLLFTSVAASAQAQSPPGADKVFQLNVAHGAHGALILNWAIAPGNYLYRDKIKVTSQQGAPVEVSTPAGAMKDDPSFGETEIYHRQVQATVSAESLAGRSEVVVSFQGCAEQGICYPPVTKTIDLKTLSVAEPAGRTAPAAQSSSNWISDPALGRPSESRGEGIGTQPDKPDLSGSFTSMLAAFVGFGLLLAFTPCVFPMIPILSGMLAQSGEKLTAQRGFVLSGAYVVAMALAYASLGVVVAWSGQNLQAALQTPLALGLMSAIFVALALSMFGLYDLQLPQAWQSRIVGAGSRRAGSLGGAAMMGFGSALIVGPCVTPPLAAALVYVAQTGNAWRGASALFALGIGMGLPLLAFGTFGASILPRSGPWLAQVKHVFGFVFLGVAIWVISRVIPTWMGLVLWGVGLAGAGVYLAVPQLRARSRGQAWRRWPVVTGITSLGFGALLMISAVAGSFGLLGQLAGITAFAPFTAAHAAKFETVTTSQALDEAIARARQDSKPVVLDFSADWCIECKVMDRTVFSDAAVLTRLRDFTLIRADATNYNENTRSLMKRFGVVGPPTIIFLNARDSREISAARIVGPVDSDTFLKRLNQLQPS